MLCAFASSRAKKPLPTKSVIRNLTQWRKDARRKTLCAFACPKTYCRQSSQRFNSSANLCAAASLRQACLFANNFSGFGIYAGAHFMCLSNATTITRLSTAIVGKTASSITVTGAPILAMLSAISATAVPTVRNFSSATAASR